MSKMKSILTVTLVVIFVAGICAQTQLNETSGAFASPNYPHDYPNSSYVEWTITLPNSDDTVFLRFLVFDTYDSFDAVQVRDGPSSSSALTLNLFGKIASGTRTLDVVSSSHQVHVTFFSSSTLSSTGFLAEYYSLTDDIKLTDTSGRFSTSNYPTNYNNNEFVRWEIQSSGTDTLGSLIFEDFETEECCDKIQICSETEILGTFSGSNLPPRVTYSSDTNLTVYFYSDFASNGKGFSASYSPGGRHHNMSNTFGDIMSENYPGNYPNFFVEQWLIEVNHPEKSNIFLLFKDFDTQSDFDVLEIYDGDNTEAPQLTSVSGAEMTQTQFLSSGKYLFLRFTTSQIISRRGFAARYEAVGPDFELPPTTTVAPETRTN